MKTLVIPVLLGLGIAVAVPPSVQGIMVWPPAEVAVDPLQPTPNDVVMITLGGQWPDACVPNGSAIYVAGNDVYFDVIHNYPASIACATVITPWQRTEKIGPLPPGTYTVYATLRTQSAIIPDYIRVAQFEAIDPQAIVQRPSALVALAGIDNLIRLRWCDYSAAELGFGLERKVGTSGAWEPLVAVTSNVTNYVDVDLLPGATCFYRVRAVTPSTVSRPSNVSSATVLRGTPPFRPIAPVNLRVLRITSSRVLVTWTDPSANENGFLIQRSTDGAAFTTVGSTGANLTSFVDKGLAPHTSYTYKVRAYNLAGRSPASNTATVSLL